MKLSGDFSDDIFLRNNCKTSGFGEECGLQCLASYCPRKVFYSHVQMAQLLAVGKSHAGTGTPVESLSVQVHA